MTPQTKRLTPEELFDIANIVSNEYIGTEKTFTTKRYVGYWLLDSGKCDMAPFIRLYDDGKVMVNGDYTEGWQSVTDYTMKRISDYTQYINSLK